MSKPTSEINEILDWICTEIGAGKAFRRGQAEDAHNNACDRAISIIHNYRDGHGLFQITRNIKRRPTVEDTQR